MCDNEKISEITDFVQYLDHLARIKNKYSVFIIAADTPSGPGFTPELSLKYMRSLGLSTNLREKYRCSYAAAIDEGKVLMEMSAPRGQKVNIKGPVADDMIELTSSGFEASPLINTIRINNDVYPNNSRGLNFIIYDKHDKTIVDNVGFDTYSGNIVSQRKDQYLNAVKKWHGENPGVGMLFFNGLVFPTENLSETERKIKAPSQGFSAGWPLKRFFDSEDDIREVLTTPDSYHDAEGVRHFKDRRGKLLNTAGGHRVTTDQPSVFRRTIYLTGGCQVCGIGTSDDRTIASYLQRLCSADERGKQFIVQNYGYCLAGTDRTDMEEVKILRSLPVKAGDIVIFGWSYNEEFPHIDLSRLSERPHDHGELFYDANHLTPDGYKLIAEKLFERLSQEEFFPELYNENEADKIAVPDILPEEIIPELEDFRNDLRGIYDEKFSVGAAVMNCNPFTLGHRYLIEQAAKQCANLIVFVVEEDSSVFRFEDRLRLVKEGTADLENVTVLPSGKFILSSLTFSEYFNKSELQDRTVDSSSDVNIFAKKIAPCLHITKRFVGTEPFDNVTKQYNNDMKSILPSYGIEVIEIPRMEKDGAAVSASEVRRLIAAEDKEGIRNIVPETTYRYIEENFDELKKLIANE